MPLHDGTPHKSYSQPRNAPGEIPRPPMNSSIVSTIVVMFFLIVGLGAAFHLSSSYVSNAPANHRL